MGRKVVKFDDVVSVIKRRLDEIDPDELEFLIEVYLPCKDVRFDVETDSFEYDVDPEVGDDAFAPYSDDCKKDE